MSGKKLLQAVCAVLFLFTAIEVRAQDAPKESMLIPVSLGVEQVEPFLTVGESVRGFKLPKGPSALALTLAGRGALTLWVSHDAAVRNSKSSLTRWALKPFWDSQGLTLLATEGHPGIRKFYGKRSGTSKTARFTTATLLSRKQGFNKSIVLLISKGGLLVVDRSGRVWTCDAFNGLEISAAVPLMVGGGRTALLIAGRDRASKASGLYLYLGRKHSGSKNLAERNGLTGGRLLGLQVAKNKNESALKKSGSTFDFTFAETPGNATRFANASGLCLDPGDGSTVYAVTRGSDARGNDGGWINHNGRLYSLTFSNPNRSEDGGKLKVLLGGTEGVIGPSCAATDGRGVVLIGEAPRFPLPGRDTSIWKYETKKGTLERLLVVRPPKGSEGERGEWRIRALLNASTELRPDWWLAAVTPGSFAKQTAGTTGQLVAVGLR